MEKRITDISDFDPGCVESDDSANLSDGGTEDDQHAERRRYRRIRTYLTGVIVDGDLTSEVIVINVSANGAKLCLKGDAPVSSQFELRIRRAG